MPTSVLYVSQLGDLGGGETVLLSHILALDPSRFSPRVICGSPGRLVDELRGHNIPVDVIPYISPYFAGGVLPIMSVGFLPRLYGYLRTYPIKLIHCSDLNGVYHVGPLAKLLNIPLVFTCWGWWLADSGWKGKYIERFCAGIVTPTEYIKQELVKLNPDLRERINVVPFGVETHDFAPQPRDPMVRSEFSIAPDAPLVTLLARFQSVKGHALLLDAIPQILDAFPAARFLFVGDTAFDTADANATRTAVYARVAADPRLRDAIVFAGFRKDVPRILNATDVLVSPSDFESYGMSILEAMACGVPVVSTNVGGPLETIADGETGFLVPAHDPQALAARVIQLLQDADLREKLGARAHLRVENKYTLSQSASDLQALYQAMLK